MLELNEALRAACGCLVVVLAALSAALTAPPDFRGRQPTATQPCAVCIVPHSDAHEPDIRL